MSDAFELRAKSLDAACQRPVIPGPNSWAQEMRKDYEAKKAQDGKPTNRLRYEINPKTTPRASSSNRALSNTRKVEQDNENTLSDPTNRVRYENKQISAARKASPVNKGDYSAGELKRDDQSILSKDNIRSKDEDEQMRLIPKALFFKKTRAVTDGLFGNKAEPSLNEVKNRAVTDPLMPKPLSFNVKRVHPQNPNQGRSLGLNKHLPMVPENSSKVSGVSTVAHNVSGENFRSGQPSSKVSRVSTVAHNVFEETLKSGQPSPKVSGVSTVAHNVSEETLKSGQPSPKVSGVSTVAHNVSEENFRSGQPSSKVSGVSTVAHNTSKGNLRFKQPKPIFSRIFNPSTQDHTRSAMEPNRQIRSNPMPTRRYFQENNITAPPPSRIPNEEMGEGSGDAPGSRNAEGVIVGHGNLNPTRTGTYARIGEVGFVEVSETQRVESQIGVIETVQSPGPSGAQRHSNSQYQGPGEETLESPESSSIYGRVWENNPRVGYTLPVYSPDPPGYPYYPDMPLRGASSNSAVTLPVMLEDSVRDQNHTSFNTPTSIWTPNLQGNSFVASGPSAGNNGVPPPPAHLYPGYQQAGSLQSVLAHLEFSLHHHIDTCFDRLSRLSAERTDNIMDKLMSSIDSLEEMVQIGFEGLEGKIKEIEKDIKTIASDSEEGLKEVKSRLSELYYQLESLETAVEEQNQGQAAELSMGALQTTDHQQAQPMHHPDEHAYTTSERGEQNLGSSNQSVSSRSGHGSGHRRSNTADGTGAEERVRRDYFATMGAAMGPAPSLRNHPAFRDDQNETLVTGDTGHDAVSGQEEHDNTVYHVPSFSDCGWYRQAYGQ